MTPEGEDRQQEPLEVDYRSLAATLRQLASEGIEDTTKSGKVLDRILYEDILQFVELLDNQLNDPISQRRNSIEIINTAKRGLHYHREDDAVDRIRFRDIIFEAVKSLADVLERDPKELKREILNSYPSPEFEVRVFHFIRGETPDDDMVALVKERVNHKWSVPGGKLEPGGSGPEKRKREGLTAAMNACKEALEEGGIFLKPRDLRPIIEYEAGLPFDEHYRHFVRKVYLAKKVYGYTEADGHETLEMRYVRMKDLGKYRLDPFRTPMALIVRAHQFFRDPALYPDDTYSYREYAGLRTGDDELPLTHPPADEYEPAEQYIDRMFEEYFGMNREEFTG